MNYWLIILPLCATFACANALLCKECLSESWDECESDGTNKSCAVGEVCFTGYSLKTDGNQVPSLGVGRGCSVNDSASTCRAVNQTLQGIGLMTTFCKGTAYCDSDLCNSDKPTPIFPVVKCKSCLGILSQNETCMEEEKVCPMGQNHCFEGTAMVTDGSYPAQLGFAKGCTYCPTAETGCTNFNETLKVTEDGLFMKTCSMTCCEGDNCNAKPKTSTVKPPTTRKPTSAGPLTHIAPGGVIIALGFVFLALH